MVNRSVKLMQHGQVWELAKSQGQVELPTVPTLRRWSTPSCRSLTYLIFIKTRFSQDLFHFLEDWFVIACICRKVIFNYFVCSTTYCIFPGPARNHPCEALYRGFHQIGGLVEPNTLLWRCQGMWCRLKELTKTYWIVHKTPPMFLQGGECSADPRPIL